MYANKNVKEQVINEIKTSMEPLLQRQQLDALDFVVSKALNHVDMYISSDLPSTKVISNDRLVQAYIVSKKIEGLSMRSLNAYLYSIKKMLLTLNMNIVDIESNAIRCYLLEYSKHASHVTVDNARRNLNSFFSWLELEGYIDKNPVSRIKKVKCEKKIKKPLTTIEVEKIRDACLNIKEIALIDLLISTGVRCEEITKITLNDIDFESQSIKIHGKGAKERLVYLSDKCKLHLIQYLEQRDYNSPYLFYSNKTHDRLTTEGISFIMRKIGNRAGVVNCQVHRFRKYFATTLFNRGCDIVYIKQLLGHSKMDTTLIYVQTTDARVRNKFQQFAA